MSYIWLGIHIYVLRKSKIPLIKMKARDKDDVVDYRDFIKHAYWLEAFNIIGGYLILLILLRKLLYFAFFSSLNLMNPTVKKV